MEQEKVNPVLCSWSFSKSGGNIRGGRESSRKTFSRECVLWSLQTKYEANSQETMCRGGQIISLLINP